MYFIFLLHSCVIPCHQVLRYLYSWRVNPNSTLLFFVLCIDFDICEFTIKCFTLCFIMLSTISCVICGSGGSFLSHNLFFMMSDLSWSISVVVCIVSSMCVRGNLIGVKPKESKSLQ